MLVLFLMIAVALVANVAFREKRYAFVVASLLGVLALWIHMVLAEFQSPDPDADLIFFMALMLWGMAVVAANAVLSGSIALACGLARAVARRPGAEK
ncbi:MAG: hypothetical protein DWQ37_15260 [Planctomycetota bacterium]|nr:MAG: hypothetical protein DWQ37_15260 [Planctomycetota bacterium]